ncbi:MAG: hypothetical protein IKZ60_04140 [Bacteroidales bacterium]|nr:hypothetical protein [Bacteroidales bacterium]
MKRIFLTIVLAIFMAGPVNSQVFEAVFQQKPESASPGSRQGGVAMDGMLFQFMDGAPAIDVYSLKKGEHLQRIPLEGRKAWHCNNACVSCTYLQKGDKYPLIYVSQENKAEHCICVFRISGKKGFFAAELVQKIILPTPVQMGLWYPNLVLDNDKEEIYVTGYSRESWKDARFGNGLQVLKFKLPAVSEGEISISADEILERRIYSFRLATQGAVIKDGRMYQVYGMAGDSAIVCYDLESGLELWAKDLTAAGIPNEPESLYFNGKELYCTDVKGIVYRCKTL